MYNGISDFERMVGGKLYNSASKDIEKQHKRGLILCDKFNRTPVWRAKKKQKTLEKLIPSERGRGLPRPRPFIANTGLIFRLESKEIGQ